MFMTGVDRKIFDGTIKERTASTLLHISKAPLCDELKSVFYDLTIDIPTFEAVRRGPNSLGHICSSFTSTVF